MVEPIEDMPVGTIGFRTDGEIRKIDARNVLIPPLRRLIRAEDEIRVLVATAGDWDRFERTAAWERIRSQWNLDGPHLELWRRVAIATDVGWIRREIRAVAWMAPAEVRLFSAADLDAAKRWLAAG